MGSRSALPVLLFAIALLAGGFYWISNRDTGEREVAGTTAPAAVTPGGEATATLTPTERPNGSLDTGSSDSARSLVSTPVQEKASTDAAPEARRNAGIFGMVVDAMGQPIAGARIFRADQVLSMGFNRITEADKGGVETDAEGRFAMNGLVPGPMRLSVRASGYAPLDTHEILVPPDAKVEVDPFVLKLGAILTGRVLDPDGRGVAGANLVRRDESGEFVIFGAEFEPTAVTDASGNFRLDELAVGPWKILVQSDEHPDRVFEGVTDRPGEVGGLEFRLRHGATISGRVTGVPDEERDQLAVRARRVDPDGGFGLELTRRSRQVDVDSSGNFEIRGLEVGETYDLSARTRPRVVQGSQFFFQQRSRSEAVRANAGDEGVEIAFQPESSLAFRVFDGESKQPITQYTVHHGMNWLTEQRGDNGRIVTDRPEGRGRLGDLRMSGPEDRLQFEIRAAGYATFRREAIALVAGEELDLGDIYLDPVPVLRLTVLDEATGEPVVGARVKLEKQPEITPGRIERRFEIDVDSEDDHGGANIELAGHEPTGVTDENGMVELTSLEGETGLVTVTKKGYAPGQIESLFMPPGEVIERSMRLGKGGSVLVQVLDSTGTPLAGQRVAHRTPTDLASGSVTMTMNSSTRQRVTDSQGQLLFENLTPGLHAFKLEEGDSGGVFMAGNAMIQMAGMDQSEEDTWTQVDVAQSLQSNVTLRAAERGALAGRVTESGIPLAGAKLSLEEKSDGPSLGFSMAGFGGGNNVRTDGNGRYSFKDVKEGEYVLTVSHPTRHMSEEFEVDVTGGSTDFNADLAVSIVEGRITGVDNEPLAGVRITSERAPEEGGPQTRQRMVMIMESDGGDTVISSGNDLGADDVYTDEDGRYSLRGVLSDTPLIIKAEGDDVQPGQSEAVTVRAGDVKQGVDLSLDVAGSVEVEALVEGSPARFCVVRANFENADENVEPKFGFIQSGKTTLRGLRPGKWLISVNREGIGSGGGSGEPQERIVDVQAGETIKETFHLDG